MNMIFKDEYHNFMYFGGQVYTTIKLFRKRINKLQTKDQTIKVTVVFSLRVYFMRLSFCGLAIL